MDILNHHFLEQLMKKTQAQDLSYPKKAVQKTLLHTQISSHLHETGEKSQKEVQKETHKRFNLKGSLA